MANSRAFWCSFKYSIKLSYERSDHDAYFLAIHSAHFVAFYGAYFDSFWPTIGTAHISAVVGAH